MKFNLTIRDENGNAITKEGLISAFHAKCAARREEAKKVLEAEKALEEARKKLEAVNDEGMQMQNLLKMAFNYYPAEGLEFKVVQRISKDTKDAIRKEGIEV